MHTYILYNGVLLQKDTIRCTVIHNGYNIHHSRHLAGHCELQRLYVISNQNQSLILNLQNIQNSVSRYLPLLLFPLKISSTPNCVQLLRHIIGLVLNYHMVLTSGVYDFVLDRKAMSARLNMIMIMIMQLSMHTTYMFIAF